MKYMKYFEMNYNEPEIGDYVICDTDYDNERIFTNANIGIIVDYDEYNNIFPYAVTYDNIPVNLINHTIDNTNIIYFNSINIKYWSKDRNELELILKSNKFNI